MEHNKKAAPRRLVDVDELLGKLQDKSIELQAKADDGLLRLIFSLMFDAFVRIINSCTIISPDEADESEAEQ